MTRERGRFTLPLSGGDDYNLRFHFQGRMRQMPLQVGDMAPDFEVPAVTGKDKSKIKLSDFRGKKNVVIAFYPLDWTPV